MSYRRSDKPPFAAWLVAQREIKGWKAEEVARRLRDQGLAAELSTYRVWESNSDRRPAADTVAALERLFGTAAPREDLDASDLAAAIREQTAAINDLVEQLARLTTEQASGQAVLMRAVGALAASLAPRRTRGEDARRAPVATGQ